MKKRSPLQKLLTALYLIVLWLVLNVSLVLTTLLKWFKDTFGVTFAEIIYTIKSPMKGADTDFTREGIRLMIPAVIAVVVLLVVAVAMIRIRRNVSVRLKIGKSKRPGLDIIAVILAAMIVIPGFLSYRALSAVNETLKLSEFIESRMNATDLYDNYYVFPDKVMSDESDGVNLLYILLESMETTYASEEVGGKQPENNYIPGLTKLAAENISFSDTDKLGGFHSCTGTGWTIAAMYACQSGVSFSFPIEGNEDFGDRESFAGGTVMLGDILDKKGYYQEFLCGSDASFGGRKALCEQHGNYHIYDLYSAIDDGYLTEDDTVWWGIEDRMLYDIAKDELTRVSSLEQPFNFTMLTVDTHHVDGWICDLCGDEYPDRLANVVQCADRQICDFIEWCKEQPWYDNTVIVIQGDHPRMDKSLVDGYKHYDRTVYNCFINARYDEDKLAATNREFTSLDMFPTILSAMGYSIEGDRLGLGTDMFSGRETLFEELGYSYVNKELKKSSSFYERYLY